MLKAGIRFSTGSSSFWYREALSFKALTRSRAGHCQPLGHRLIQLRWICPGDFCARRQGLWSWVGVIEIASDDFQTTEIGLVVRPRLR